MTLANEKDIGAAIRGDTIRPPILLYGNEEYLKQQTLHSLIDSPDDKFSEFNDIRMDFAGLDVAALFDAVVTLPLMARRKTVLVYDVEPKGIPADLFKRLDELFAAQCEECRLIFAEKSGAVDDKRCDKSKKLIRMVDKAGTVLCLKERTEAQLGKMVKADVEKVGCSISPAAQKALIARCGRDTAALKSETNKLCAYRQAGEITREDIELLTEQKPEDNIYGLSRAILRGDYDGAMALLSGLFTLRYPPENILGTLAACYVDLYRAKASVRARKPAAQAAADFGYGKRAFAMENAMRDQKPLGEGYLLYTLDVLSGADLRLKSTQNDARTVLEGTVAALFLREGAPGGRR